MVSSRANLRLRTLMRRRIWEMVMDYLGGGVFSWMKGMGRMGDWGGMAAILAKSRLFPLISGHLSRAGMCDMGVNGGGLGGFGAILVVLAGV